MQLWSVCTELLSNLFLGGLVWLGVRLFGLAGSGIGFFGVYLLYSIGIYIVARKLSGFRWSSANWRLLFILPPLLAAVFLAGQYLTAIVSVLLGTVVTGCAGIYSLKTLCCLVSVEQLPRFVQKLLTLLRLMSPPATPEHESQ